MLDKWVYDLVIRVIEWEDTGHDIPSADLSAAQIKALCHSKWLAEIPDEVVAAARAIRSYKSDVEPQHCRGCGEEDPNVNCQGVPLP